jgi:hypothetical protein
MPVDLTAAMRRALLDDVVQATLGLSYFFDYYRPTVEPLLAAAPATGSLTDAKALGFGHLLAAEFDAKTLLAAWARAGALMAQGAADGSAALKQAFTEARAGDADGQARVNRLWEGWLTGDNYDSAYAPAALGDQDGDGVPDYYEAKVGTKPDNPDSDGDGWSDLAELVLGTDPTSASNMPNVIAPDGSFSDWQQLLPKRLIAGKGQPNGVCPKAATISYYAALADHDALVIGAYADDFIEDEPKASWVVGLDFVSDKRQVLLTAAGNSYTYELRDPNTQAVIKSYRRAYPIAGRTFEVAVRRAALALPTFFDATDAVKVQLKTVYTDKDGDHVCDQTDWFTPYITGS